MKWIASLLLAASLGLAVSPALAAPYEAKIVLAPEKTPVRIDRNIYGQFVEHLGRGVYEGIWVGEESSIPNVRGIRSDVVAALRKIKVPLVRWPGGCFAEVYHWRDGVGPASERPVGVNTAWGDEPETNAFGSHEFFDFLEQIDAQAFININMDTGSPAEAQDWLQYLTAPASSAPGKRRAANGHPAPYKVTYVGIGNENWGCGGNMTAEYYSDLYRQYYSVLRPYGTIVASDANSDDYAWTETLLKKALYRHANPTPLAYINRSPQIQMMSVHYYTLAGNDWGNKGAATGFSEQDWALAMDRAYKMDEILGRHSAILDRYDPERKIGLSVDEWGTWWNAEKDRPSNLYQPNTLRDAIVAATTLNIFQNRAERVRMANIAQMVNVLQAMILTRGDKMIVTPTYQVFDLYQVHQNATRVLSDVQAPDYTAGTIQVPALSASASTDSKGDTHLTLVNVDPKNAASVTLDATSFKFKAISARVLTAPEMDAHPSFERPDPVPLQDVKPVSVRQGQVKLDLPAKSVTLVTLSN